MDNRRWTTDDQQPTTLAASFYRRSSVVSYIKAPDKMTIKCEGKTNEKRRVNGGQTEIMMRVYK